MPRSICRSCGRNWPAGGTNPLEWKRSPISTYKRIEADSLLVFGEPRVAPTKLGSGREQGALWHLQKLASERNRKLVQIAQMILTEEAMNSSARAERARRPRS
jgi:hypothetical protein